MCDEARPGRLREAFSWDVADIMRANRKMVRIRIFFIGME